MSTYRVIVSTDPDADCTFADAVEQYIADGYELVGGASIAFHPTTYKFVMAQALVKTDD